MEVSPSGYYAWRTRPASARQRQNQDLAEQIEAVHTASRGTYGSRRVQAQLRAQGQPCSRNRVAHLMRSQGLQGRGRRRFRVTTDSRHSLPVAPNQLAQDFTTTAPDQVWVSDITYLRTDEGWLYLATVLDLYSRKVVGWSLQPTLEQSLPLAALEMALAQRRPGPGLVHHSDRGSQYASHAYQALLQRHRLRCSMSRKGNVWDNAPQESFFGTLKRELPKDRWPTRELCRREVFAYLEVFYNRQRLHSSLGYRSPVDFEAEYGREAA
jgi:transposase InsO family protein